MRIGIDCRLWNESGVGRYTRNLIKNLKDIDRENEYVLFVLLKDQKEILKQSMKQVQDRVQNDKFNIVISDIRWHTIEEQLRLTAILNKEGLDLVHFPYVSVPIFYNKPFVVTIHDLILHHFPTGEASILPLPLYYLKHLAYKYVIKHAAQKAEKIITVSKATKDEIIEHLREGISDANTKHLFAIASKAGSPNPSIRDGIINARAFLYKLDNCSLLTSPKKITDFPKPIFFTFSFSLL